MEVETAAGVVLVAGSVACSGSVIAGRPAPLARAGLAVALAIAAVGEFAGNDAAELTACAVAPPAGAALPAPLATAAVGGSAGTEAGGRPAGAAAAAAIAALVLMRLGPVSRLSWLDAAMGASAPAGLAVVLGTDPAGAVGAGGA